MYANKRWNYFDKCQQYSAQIFPNTLLTSSLENSLESTDEK